jgi:O-antigen/teichoic acid export membrane protein
MRCAMRMFLSVVLLALLGFCVFGFFASYELPPSWDAQVIYALVAGMSALATAGLWCTPRGMLRE